MCGVCLSNVRKRLRVAQHGQRLLQLREVLGADQYGGLATVASDHDTVVFALDSVDEFGEMISD
jgi:hypothetical protein